MKTNAGVLVTWVRHAAEIPPEIWAECFPPPLEGRWWYETLEKSALETQFLFLYALIHLHGVVVGVVPCFLMNVPISLVAPSGVAKLLDWMGAIIPRCKYQRTLFVGSPCSDEGTIGVVRDITIATIAPGLQAALQAKAQELRAPLIVWKDLPDRAAQELAALSPSLGLFKLLSFPGTCVSLGGTTFGSYLKTFNADRRYRLTKKLKRSAKMGRLETAVVQQPDAAMRQEIFRLFWQTYQKGKTKFETLTPAFFEHIALAPNSYFVLLRDPATGKLVAFMLCFHGGTRIINKFIGLDYTYTGDWFLYFRLWQAAVSWAMTAGGEEIQSGQTGYRAKYDLGHKLMGLTNFCKHRNPLLHWVFHRMARQVTWRTLDLELGLYYKNAKSQPPYPEKSVSDS